jgi:hypothetical protein
MLRRLSHRSKAANPNSSRPHPAKFPERFTRALIMPAARGLFHARIMAQTEPQTVDLTVY